MNKFRALFFSSFVVFGSVGVAQAAVRGWDSRIDLTEAQVEYVTEAAAKLESEWMDDENMCVLTQISEFELQPGAIFVRDQVMRFQINSEVTLGGPRCPGQVMGCESVFSWVGPQDWEVKTHCEDPS